MHLTKKLWALAKIIVVAGGLAGGKQSLAHAQTLPDAKEKISAKKIPEKNRKTKKQKNPREESSFVSSATLKDHIEKQIGLFDLTMATDLSFIADNEDRGLLRAFNQNARAMGIKNPPIIFVYRKEGSRNFQIDPWPNAYSIQLEGDPVVVGFSSSLIYAMFPDLPKPEQPVSALPSYLSLTFHESFNSPSIFNFLSLANPAAAPTPLPKNMFPPIPEERRANIYRLLGAIDAHENAHDRLGHAFQYTKAYKQKQRELKEIDEKEKAKLADIDKKEKAALAKTSEKNNAEIQKLYKHKHAVVEVNNIMARQKIEIGYLKKLAGFEKAADLLAVRTTHDPGGLKLALDALFRAAAAAGSKTYEQYLAEQNRSAHPLPQTRLAYLDYMEHHPRTRSVVIFSRRTNSQATLSH